MFNIYRLIKEDLCILSYDRKLIKYYRQITNSTENVLYASKAFIIDQQGLHWVYRMIYGTF